MTAATTGGDGFARDAFPVERVAVDPEGGLWLDVPQGWVVSGSGPVVATPRVWHGEPPAVVAARGAHDLAGDRLARALLRAAATLADPVVIDLRRDDSNGGVEIVVAHRHRGHDVTTVERHHPRDDSRWAVGFTACDLDAAILAPLVHRVVASLGPAAGPGP